MCDRSWCILCSIKGIPGTERGWGIGWVAWVTGIMVGPVGTTAAALAEPVVSEVAWPPVTVAAVDAVNGVAIAPQSAMVGPTSALAPWLYGFLGLLYIEYCHYIVNAIM